MKAKNVFILIIMSLSIIISGIVLFINLDKTEEKPDDLKNKPEFNISGKYICYNDFYNEDFYNQHPEQILAITFYEDNNCNLIVHYIGGTEDVSCAYDIKENIIEVNLDLRGTVLYGTDSRGVPYMDDQYVFSIIDNNNIIIDKGFYTVNAGDIFIKR